MIVLLLFETRESGTFYRYEFMYDAYVACVQIDQGEVYIYCDQLLLQN